MPEETTVTPQPSKPDHVVVCSFIDGQWTVEIRSKTGVPFLPKYVKMINRNLSIKYREGIRDARIKVNLARELEKKQTATV